MMHTNAPHAGPERVYAARYGSGGWWLCVDDNVPCRHHASPPHVGRQQRVQEKVRKAPEARCVLLRICESVFDGNVLSRCACAGILASRAFLGSRCKRKASGPSIRAPASTVSDAGRCCARCFQCLDATPRPWRALCCSNYLIALLFMLLSYPNPVLKACPDAAITFYAFDLLKDYLQSQEEDEA